MRPASPDESPDRLDGPVLRHGRAAGVRVDRAGPQGGKGLFAMCRTHADEDSREPMDASVEHAGFLSSWVGPMLALGIGAVLWSVGGRVSRDALGVLGFAVGVPVGAITATWLGWIWLPPLAGAIVGAIGGLVLARVAYRLALIVVMTAASAALGAVICAALVDRGAVAAPDRKDEVAAQAAGRPSVFGHGMFTAGLLANAISDYVGVGNLTNFKVRFTKQTWPDEVLTTKVVVTGKREEDGRKLVDLEVEVANGDGEVKVAGSAVALADA